MASRATRGFIPNLVITLKPWVEGHELASKLLGVGVFSEVPLLVGLIEAASQCPLQAAKALRIYSAISSSRAPISTAVLVSRHPCAGAFALGRSSEISRRNPLMASAALPPSASRSSLARVTVSR